MPQNEGARDTEHFSSHLPSKEGAETSCAAKNTQQLVILGVAVVMVLIMWLTGNGKRPTAATTAPAPGERQPATVQDFKQSIQKDQAAMRQPIAG